MMEMFTKIQDGELQELNGGSITLTVLGVLGTVTGMYFGLREIVRDAGMAAAYRDLGM